MSNLNQKANFTEVWIDLTLSIPYVLLVVGSINSCKVIDPRKNNKVLYIADYNNVSLWLQEDEYELAEGRMTND
jgi:hypothetical protein